MNEPGPAWNSGEAGEILQEFYGRLNESIVVLVLARRGLSHQTNQTIRDMATAPPTPENPDPLMLVGTQSERGTTRVALASISRSKFFELLVDGIDENSRARAYVEMSQQWILMTFAIWEENFRPRIAAAAKLDLKEVTIPAIGDLRHMRNDIAHHLGIASKRNAARCTLFKFAVGEVVYARVDDLPPFIDALPGYKRAVWGETATKD